MPVLRNVLECAAVERYVAVERVVVQRGDERGFVTRNHDTADRATGGYR
jgi:hypothetical protein